MYWRKGQMGWKAEREGEIKGSSLQLQRAPNRYQVENWCPDHSPFAMLQKWGHPGSVLTMVEKVIFVATVAEDEEVLSFSAACISIPAAQCKAIFYFPPLFGMRRKMFISLCLTVCFLYWPFSIMSFRQMDTVNLQTSRQDGLRKLPITLLNWWNTFHRVGVPIQSSQMQAHSEPP